MPLPEISGIGVLAAFLTSATALGQLLLAYRYELNIVGGALPEAFTALVPLGPNELAHL